MGGRNPPAPRQPLSWLWQHKLVLIAVSFIHSSSSYTFLVLRDITELFSSCTPIIRARAASQTLSNEVSVNFLVLLFYCEIDGLFTFPESVGVFFSGNCFLFSFAIIELLVFFFF